ncbi:MAG: tRNA uracil 4-sulfurtransferase ThiI [Gemmatimonadota bacterium]
MRISDSRGVRRPADVEAGPDDASSRDVPVRVLIRLSGEITTKARRARARFLRTLADNLREAGHAGGWDCRVSDEWSRLFLEAPDVGVLEQIARVFGISSFSVVEAECAARLEEIVRVGAELYGERVRGRRFAVRARRSGRHPFDSQDVMRELGAALNREAVVDLEEPEIEVQVEVRGGRAYLYSERVLGAGGLPLGVQRRAVALLSGGFDSAVAAWMMLRRGVALDYAFCNLGGGAYRRLVLEVAKSLADRWSFGTQPEMHILDFGPVAGELRAKVRPGYQQLVLKRWMYRAASRIAAERGADAIVTGEAVGQVSSQTLTNLRAIEEAAEVPVLRPLVGFDKGEIIQRARDIGTHDLSSRVREYCAISPGRPVTAARPEAVGREEAALDPSILETVLAGRDVLALRSLDTMDIVAPALFVEDVPEGAIVIDTREEAEYRSWHWPGSIRRDFDELLRRYGELDRDEEYVLYCAQGLRSGQLAERMQAAGYEAYSFRGGLPGLRRLAARRGLVRVDVGSEDS